MYFYVCFIKWQSFAIETGSTEVFLYLTSIFRIKYATFFWGFAPRMTTRALPRTCCGTHITPSDTQLHKLARCALFETLYFFSGFTLSE